jgi:hypothetical protein
MKISNLIELIDNSLQATKLFVDNSTYLNDESKSIVHIRKVLLLLKNEVEVNPDAINQRVLRGMSDIAGSAAKSFENTIIEENIGKVSEELYKLYPHYKDLTPLGMDFGKGNPI